MAVPHIISESRVTIFKFYENAEIHEAILVNNQIMRLAGDFATEQHQAAIAFAYKLCQQYPTVITPNASRYRVWVDVRCSEKFDIGKTLSLSTPGSEG
jgi:hypothetical protein